ncbi:kelch motif-containing protein [Myxococcota bacterium]|nr:kelch motif-containing protein [Myxococcota bacterium]
MELPRLRRLPAVAAALTLSACAAEGPAPRYSHVAALTADGAALCVAGGAGGDGRRPDAWCFDLDRRRWEEVTPPPAPIFRACHVQTAEAAWIVGGADAEGEPVDTLWRWDLTDLTWEQLSPDGPPPPRRVKAGCALSGDRMLLGGGRIGEGDDQRIYGDLFALDLNTLTWAELPQLPEPVQRQAMATLGDGELVILGGIDAEGDRLATLMVGDPDRGDYTGYFSSGEAPERRASHTLAPAADGAVVAWGGHPTDTTLWRFDGAGFTHSDPAAEAPSARDAHATAPSPDGEALYLMGGDPFVDLDAPFLNDLWRADLTTLTWEHLDP